MKVSHHEFLVETVYETESEESYYIAMALSVQEEASSYVEEETFNEKTFRG